MFQHYAENFTEIGKQDLPYIFKENARWSVHS